MERGLWTARSRGLVPALLLVSGCGDRLVLEAPPGVEHWALVALDADDQVAASTPLRPGAERLELEIPLGARGYLLEYGAGLLDRLEVSAPGPDPLTLAAGCDLRLPSPDRLETVALDRLEDAELSELPALTAPWLSARCQDLDPASLLVDSACVPVYCPVAVSRDGCTLRLDGAACDFGTISVTLERDGEVCVAADVCEVETKPSGGLAGLSCSRSDNRGSCPVQIYAAGSFPAVELERVQVVETTPHLPSNARYRPESLRTGRVDDLLVTDTHVFVTSAESSEYAPDRCRRRGRAQRLHAYATDDLRPLFSRNSGRCALSPLEVPGSRILGFNVDGASGLLLSQLISFDGELVRTTSISFGDFELANVVASVRLGPDENIVLIASTQVTGATLVSVRDDGTLRWTEDLAEIEPSGVTRFRDGFVVTDSYRDGLWTFGADGTQREIQYITDSVSRNPGEPHLHESSGYVSVPVSRDVRYVVSLQSDGTLHPRRVVNNERPVLPTAIGAWPLEASWVLVGMTLDAPEQPEALLGLLDPVEGHYRPGMLSLGFGVVSAIRTDPQGRVYILLSWAAQLVRLSPP